MNELLYKAIRANDIGVLKKTSKKECNTRDADDLTPTLMAAFQGQLDALRVLVGRGGNPDKCDKYGNSALHLAAARGHLNCVVFLATFGANIWTLDVDFHTAKHLAALNNHENVVQYLDLLESQDIADGKDVPRRKALRIAKRRREKLLKSEAKSNSDVYF